MPQPSECRAPCDRAAFDETELAPSLLLHCGARRWAWSRAGGHITTDFLQLHLEHRAIDLGIRVGGKSCALLSAGGVMIAFRQQGITADLTYLRRECPGAIDIEQFERLILLALLDQHACGAQAGDLGQLLVL